MKAAIAPTMAKRLNKTVPSREQSQLTETMRFLYLQHLAQLSESRHRRSQSAAAADLDDGSGGGLNGQGDTRVRIGGQGGPGAVPGSAAGDGSATEGGTVAPGVSRLPAGESHSLAALHP